jgi:4-diphosphocytidyl-2-C-methyl-D-erythritol kinase
MTVAEAHAKVNLALVVGSRRDDGKHEVVSVVEKVSLADTITVAEHSAGVSVTGFADDTLVRHALGLLLERRPAVTGLEATIEKRIPAAAGLGGGSSDAATALRLGNRFLTPALGDRELHGLAAGIGADVPLFLHSGPVLVTGDGTTVERLSLPGDYYVLLFLPTGAAKGSTASVYRDFDSRRGEAGFDWRREQLLTTLAGVGAAGDLATLPANDLTTSVWPPSMRELGAFRADVSGAGPTVYGLFHAAGEAERAAATLATYGRTWVTVPVRP